MTARSMWTGLMALVTALALVPAVAGAAGVVSGVIIDGLTGQPVRGATVTVKGTEVTFSSDIGGSFRADVAAATYGIFGLVLSGTHARDYEHLDSNRKWFTLGEEGGPLRLQNDYDFSSDTENVRRGIVGNLALRPSPNHTLELRTLSTGDPRTPEWRPDAPYAYARALSRAEERR